MRRWVFTIAVVLLSVSSARAGAVWYFQGEGPGPPIQLSFGGILPSVYVPTTASVGFTLSAEGQTRTIYFNYFSFSSEPFTAQSTDTYLVDGSFTELRTLQSTVTLDPITVSTKHLGPFLLEANSSIGEIYDNGMLDPFDQMRLIYGTSPAITGSVTVAGATKPLSQSFSMPTSPQVGVSYPGHPSGTISTGNFPNSVVLYGFDPSISLGESDSVVFSGTVDDVSFSETVSDIRFMGIGSGLFMYGESGAVAEGLHTPEPTAGWLVLLAFFTAVVFACLRSRAKSQARPGQHTPPGSNQP